MAQKARKAARGGDSVGSGPSDADLIERFLQGEEEAFDELVFRYEQVVRSLLRKLVGNAADAEDLAQETFIRIFRGLDRFRGAATLKTWIFKIATNCARDWMRAKKARPPGIRLDAMTGDPPAGEKAEAPLEKMAHEEQRQVLAAAMNRLPFQQRVALVLKIAEGLDYNEIARVLDTTPDSIKSSIHWARKRMARMLKDRL